MAECLFSQNWDKIETKSFRDGSQDICKDKEVIWDQLLATKPEIIKGKLYFRFAREFFKTARFRINYSLNYKSVIFCHL